MPTPAADLILTSQRAAISVALEPAHIALSSLMLLIHEQPAADLNDWVTRALDSLSPKQQRTNHLVVIGLFYAVNPVRSYPSFMAYVDDLAAQDPLLLRDRILATYVSTPLLNEQDARTEQCLMRLDPAPLLAGVDVAPLLADVDVFLDFLRVRFSEVDAGIEAEAHALLNDPPAMQALIVSHLREMWDVLLADEWSRTLSTLETSVNAFQQLDFRGLDTFEVVQLVVGRDLKDKLGPMLDYAEQVVLIPSPHLGPYVSKFRTEKTLWLLFGARLPEGLPGVQPVSLELMRSTLLVRLRGLADDTRLQVLRLLAEEGELCSKDIIQQLSLSQSAASRHLTQLTATGYLSERRREGAKCYSLNYGRVEDTCQALTQFLLNK